MAAKVTKIEGDESLFSIEVEEATLILGRHGPDSLHLTLKTTPTMPGMSDAGAHLRMDIARGHGVPWIRLNFPGMPFTVVDRQ